MFDIHSDNVIVRIVFNTGPMQRENKKFSVLLKKNEDTDWPMFQEFIKNKFKKVKFDNQNTSDVRKGNNKITELRTGISKEMVG